MSREVCLKSFFQVRRFRGIQSRTSCNTVQFRIFPLLYLSLRRATYPLFPEAFSALRKRFLTSTGKSKNLSYIVNIFSTCTRCIEIEIALRAAHFVFGHTEIRQKYEADRSKGLVQFFAQASNVARVPVDARIGLRQAECGEIDSRYSHENAR